MKAWTEYVPLPGGDIEGDFDDFLMAQKEKYPFVPETLLYRYARAYGTRMDVILASAKSLGELGTHYGDNIYDAEIFYLLRYEFAVTLNDILWRRSKLLLHTSEQTRNQLELALPRLIKAIAQEDNHYAAFARH